jgi:hypothetical protein
LKRTQQNQHREGTLNVEPDEEVEQHDFLPMATAIAGSGRTGANLRAKSGIVERG